MSRNTQHSLEVGSPAVLGTSTRKKGSISRKQQNQNRSRTNGRVEVEREPLSDSIPFWRNLDIITQYQKNIAENFRGIFPGTKLYQNFFQLAPTELFQEILRSCWSFSVFNFTKEIRGNPQKESKILTEVAGYGSQLGTIMDFLNVFQEKYQVNIDKLSTEEKKLMVLKFRDLYRKINQAKGRPEPAK